MLVSREPLSNEIEQSILQCEKYDAERIWTWRGIVTDFSQEPANAFGPMRVNWESVSNETDESDSRPMKHSRQRF
jgi:hypothetical protein